MTSIDLTKQSKELYTATREPGLVDVPEFSFLMVDGHGDPNETATYGQALEALYSVSYTLKFTLKRASLPLDYRVMPLEGLWWVPDMRQFSIERKADWDWTMMIRQPDEVDERLFVEARQQAAAKKDLPAAPLLRLAYFTEGLAAQALHLGPYSAEGPTIQRLHAFIAEQGLERTGRHHEIYLGDPRRSAPDRLKTVLRQPVAEPG